MNTLQIIQAIIGISLALFIPGYLAARIFFKEMNELEKTALGFVLSIAINILVGLFLGYNETMKNLTGGITPFNLWLYLGTITIALFCIYLIRNKDEVEELLPWLRDNNKKIRNSNAKNIRSNVEDAKRPPRNKKLDDL